MRQRKAKDLEKRLRECSAYMTDDPGQDGRDYFGRGTADGGYHRDLFVEIGCGKGQFIISKAASHPEADFIAIEGQRRSGREHVRRFPRQADQSQIYAYLRPYHG